MPTHRQNILSNIKTTLDSGVFSLEIVEINRATPLDLNAVTAPLCFIYAGEETRDTVNGSINTENFVWDIFLQVWAPSDFDLETILGEIHFAMHSDFTRGGFATLSRRLDTEPFSTEGDIQGLLITYEVLYSHPLGVM